MARESTIQILYGSSATTAPNDLSNGEFAYAHGSKKLFIGSGGNNTAIWLGGEILDEDNMSSNSNTALATQQSIKAYVDNSISTSAGVLSVEGLTGAIDVTSANGVSHNTSGGSLNIVGITATTSQIGVASFSSGDFSVSNGAVSIKTAGVDNVQLANSSVSFGGVSVSLGSSDATPAFNLADATGLPTTALTGTITTAQIGNSQVTNEKLANSSITLGGVNIALGGTDATPAFNLADATGLPTSALSGTISNGQLANSSVSFGGVSVSLGSSDATPAFNLADATGLPTSALTGTITTAQIGASQVTNDKLANSSVSFGGVSVSLGSSDATPAFNLADATGLPTTALTGTITTAQIGNSQVTNAKLANASHYFTNGTSSGSVALGATLGIVGTSNEVEVSFSGTTFTIGLPNDVTIAGNLTVNGTVTTIDTTNLVVEDPLIKLAKNNNTTDSVDIGFYGLYDTSGSQDLYAGLFRDQSDGKFRLFSSLQTEPTTTVNTAGTGYAVATLVANLSGGSF